MVCCSEYFLILRLTKKAPNSISWFAVFSNSTSVLVGYIFWRSFIIFSFWSGLNIKRALDLCGESSFYLFDLLTMNTNTQKRVRYSSLPQGDDLLLSLLFTKLLTCPYEGKKSGMPIWTLQIKDSTNIQKSKWIIYRHETIFMKINTDWD